MEMGALLRAPVSPMAVFGNGKAAWTLWRKGHIHGGVVDHNARV